MLSGLREGLTPDDFRTLQAENPGESWNELERAVIAAADDLWRQQRVGDEAWTVLSGHFSTGQILELLYVIGAYLALAGILNTGDVPVEGAVLQQATALGLPMLSEK